ncbi:MAG: hypothetical protein K2M13_10585, partial [Muribaculaceae bacterium]|nr:hypothetical protein [Muribaculaceae bacterium]
KAKPPALHFSSKASGSLKAKPPALHFSSKASGPPPAARSCSRLGCAEIKPLFPPRLSREKKPFKRHGKYTYNYPYSKFISLKYLFRPFISL